MIEITRQHGGKSLRIFIEDGTVMLSAKDVGLLINDKNPAKRLERAGVPHARYRQVATNGGVQRMRLITPKECDAVFCGLRQTAVHDSLLGWMRSLMAELVSMKCDFCGGC